MKRGFTLAEVLITLAIIGVVAALTIPTLMQKADRRETISKFKKAYNTVANAYSLMSVNEGKIDLKCDETGEDATLLAQYLKPYLNIIKDCGLDGTGCVGDSYYKLDGTFRGDYSHADNYYKVLLSDGSALMFRTNLANQRKALLWLDINGPKKPNKMSVDTFAFWLTNDGRVLPHNTDGACPQHEDACAGYILHNDNMDYLDEY